MRQIARTWTCKWSKEERAHSVKRVPGEGCGMQTVDSVLRCCAVLGGERAFGRTRVLRMLVLKVLFEHFVVLRRERQRDGSLVSLPVEAVCCEAALPCMALLCTRIDREPEDVERAHSGQPGSYAISASNLDLLTERKVQLSAPGRSDASTPALPAAAYRLRCPHSTSTPPDLPISIIVGVATYGILTLASGTSELQPFGPSLAELGLAALGSVGLLLGRFLRLLLGVAAHLSHHRGCVSGGGLW